MSLRRLDPPLCIHRKGRGGGEFSGIHVPTFDAESKIYGWGVGGRRGSVFDYVRHLRRIWGELLNFDKNCSHSVKASSSQIVSKRCQIVKIKQPKSIEVPQISVCQVPFNPSQICPKISSFFDGPWHPQTNWPII